jgi:Tfp pilus assembly PilM family ATPase
MATQTAIEYAGRRVRLLEFDGTSRKLRVVGVQDVDLDVPPQGEGGPDPDDLRARAIAAAMKDAGFSNDPSAMAFDAAHAMFREFDLPFTNEEQIAKVVRFESESHFPGDIDDVIIQHIVLRKLRDKSHLLVVAVRKDDLLDRLDILEESGLDPQLVDIDVFAMYHALVGTGVADEHPRQIIVDADTSTTTLMFLVDGTLFAVRSIRIGAHGVAAAEPPAEDGGEPAPASASASGSAAAAARSAARDTELETARTHDYLSRLTREIRRTLSTLPDFGQADALYVTGSGSRLPGMREALTAAFGLQAKTLNLLERVDHKLDDAELERYGPEFGAALGMAYKLSGLDRTRTDFRREEAAYTRKFDQVKTPLIVLALMGFLVTAFLALHAFMDVKRLKAEYGDPVTQGGILGTGDKQLVELFDSEKELAEARARIAAVEFGPKRVQTLVNEIQKLGEGIKQDLGRSTTIPELRSALGAWIELFEVIRENESTLGRIALSRIDIDATTKQPNIKLSGEMEDLTHLSTFMDLLKARPMFKQVGVGPTKPTSKGTMSFTDMTIELDLSGGAAADEAEAAG